MQKYKYSILCAVILLAFGVTGASVLAQNATGFDFGCWGVFTGGGGNNIQSNTLFISTALGQPVNGEVRTNSSVIRIGYIQNWRTTEPVIQPSPTITPTSSVTPTNSIFLPLLVKDLFKVRPCS